MHVRGYGDGFALHQLYELDARMAYMERETGDTPALCPTEPAHAAPTLTPTPTLTLTPTLCPTEAAHTMLNSQRTQRSVHHTEIAGHRGWVCGRYPTVTISARVYRKPQFVLINVAVPMAAFVVMAGLQVCACVCMHGMHAHDVHLFTRTAC